MEFKTTLKTRRAVRDYTEQPVDAEAIEEVIAAAVLAPSAKNLQPWAFAVIRGTDRLHALAAKAKDHILSQLPPDSPQAIRLADPQFEIFYGAAALIVVSATSATSQAFEDCCLAAANLMLAAHANGLGTCWIGTARPWLNIPEVKAELGIPESLVPVAPLIVGHPRTHPAPTPREKPRIVWCR